MNTGIKKISFRTSPLVCSQQINIELENDMIRKVSVLGGCPGNLKGICSLIKGMSVQEVIKRLDGITCGDKPTSCPDQLAKALKAYLAEQKKS